MENGSWLAKFTYPKLDEFCGKDFPYVVAQRRKFGKRTLG